jgi:hypothetical protein
LVGSKGREHTKTAGGIRIEKVFCVNCGADGGGVIAENVPHVFYLCNECARRHGDGGLPRIPDEYLPRTRKLYTGISTEAKPGDP